MTKAGGDRRRPNSPPLLPRAPPEQPNPPPGALIMLGGERTKHVVSCKRWQKRKQYLAQGPNKTTCFWSSHAVSGIHGKNLGRGGGNETDDTTHPPSVAISEGVGMRGLDGLEG